MRVISQNGTIDIPYDMTAFHLSGGMIHINMAGEAGRGTLMAQYESTEKAQKAMDMMHEAYTGFLPGVVVGNGCSVDSIELEKLFKARKGLIMQSPPDKGSLEFHWMPRIFKFPEDSEIEVEV